MLTCQITEVQEKEVKINSIFTLPGMGCVPWKEFPGSFPRPHVRAGSPFRSETPMESRDPGNHRSTVPVVGALTKMGPNFVKVGVGRVA